VQKYLHQSLWSTILAAPAEMMLKVELDESRGDPEDRSN
jgi:hypothetical protein